MPASPRSVSLLAARTPLLRALHGWYATAQRPLPWRTEPSLYRTVVSEFMLQQTQVATVLPYFARWVQALPSFAALAAATPEQVLKLWEGLGYYSRARHLHQLARILATRPAPPRRPAEWRELPGIGPYTAAAITSIALGEPAACVDGNVVRVLARLTATPCRFRDGAAAAKCFTPLAGALIAGAADPGQHNQALMELGAILCLRHRPGCPRCPVADFCAARRAGSPADYPRLQARRITSRAVSRACCLDRGALLLQRTSAGARRLAGLHELPVLAVLGRNADGLVRLAVRHRSITRHRFTETIYAVPPTAALRARVARTPGLIWARLSRLEHLSLSGPHRRWLADLLRPPPSASGRPPGEAPHR